MYQNAIREHQAGSLDVAEKLYHDILKNDPKNPDVLHLLGILLAQQQDFANARLYIEQALLIVPDAPTLHNSMGNVLKNLEQYEDAVSHYKIALQLQPDNPSAHNNLGVIFHKLNNMDEAKDHYYEAIKLHPQYVDAYYNLSLVLTKQGFKDEARKNLELVLQLQPNHVLAHSSLAYLLQLQGEFDLALHHYQESLKLDDNHSVMAHHNLGVILTDKGRVDEAIVHFKKVLDLQPEHVEALHNLGSIFLLQQKPAFALPFFLRLLELNKDFVTYYNLGVIYSNLGKGEEALGYFIESLKIVPDDFAANVNLGGLYLQRREFEQAEQCYLKAAISRPEDEEVAYILAAIGQKSDQSKAPATYVKHLFDQYAPYFEKHLEFLGHQVPQLLFDAVVLALGDGNSSWSVLDLGCGTGTSGVKFKSRADRLIGIDVSEKMLELARGKNVYTDLRLGSLEDTILEFSDMDVVIAADTLVYFGELGDVFAQCLQALKQGGVFAFSVEEADVGVYPYVLQRSARFAHSNKYILDVASRNNFTVLSSARVVLRKHEDASIFGNLFVLKK